MNIYEIDKALLDCIDLETGEILDEAKMDELKMTREAKVENVALWYKQLSAESKAIKDEEKNLSDRRKATDRKAESLKSWLQSALSGEKLETPRVKVSYRKSTTMSVIDKEAVPEAYKRSETVETIDTITIKKDMVAARKLRDQIEKELNTAAPDYRLLEKLDAEREKLMVPGAILEDHINMSVK